MFEKEFHISRLLAGHFRYKLNADEELELQHWIEESVGHKAYFDALSEGQMLPEKLRKFDSIKISAKNEVWNKVQNNIENGKKVELWPRVAIAASIALAVITGGYFYYNSQKQTKETTAYQTDIAPGKNGATLTLSSGKRIFINDQLSENIAEEAGVRITKSEEGVIVYEVVDKVSANGFNTLSTSRGEQTQVLLSDGSSVWLNAESSLKYPNNFAGKKNREVELLGEGYFSISKDKQHPFIVKSEGQWVEVLGTEFNINAYPDVRNTKTTLLEGKVNIVNGVSKQSMRLLPGEQSNIEKGRTQISKVTVDDAVAWKNGFFMYDGETLEMIMKDMSRWYNVNIVFKDESIKKEIYFISVSRFDKFSKLLKLLARTEAVKFSIQGNTIIADKDN